MWSSDDGGRSWAELPATPLHWAASHGSADDVARLVAAGDDVDARSHGGLTPLHLACLNGHTATAEALIARGADIEAKSVNDGWTPLHLACSHGHTATAEALIARGADIRAEDRHGRSPLPQSQLPQ